MDPLTAFSLAGTIVQFLGFTIKILATGHELYNSTKGTLAANEEVERVVLHISHLTTKLQRPLQLENVSRELTTEEKALQDICNQCETVAKELLTRLERLKVGKEGLKQVLQTALRATWAKKELESLVRKLENFKKSLELHILVALK
jgi:hypothetical protein